MSAIGEVTITNSIRRWERKVEQRTRTVAAYREKMQHFATALARFAAMGDPLVSPYTDVQRTYRFLRDAERSLQAAEERLAFYRGRLVLERG